MTRTQDGARREALVLALFTPRAFWAQATARQFAKEDGYLGTGHILRALLDATDGQAARVLRQFDIDEAGIALLCEFGAERERPRDGDDLFTTSASGSLPTSLSWDMSMVAMGRSRQSRTPYTTASLLVAVLSVPTSFAVHALKEVGVSPRRLRAEAKREIGLERAPRSEIEVVPTSTGTVSHSVTIPHDIDLVWRALTDLQLFGQSDDTVLVDATRTSKGDGAYFETLSLSRDGESEIRTFELWIDEGERVIRRSIASPESTFEPCLTTRIEAQDGATVMVATADYRYPDASRAYATQVSDSMLTWAVESAEEVETALANGWTHASNP